MVAAAAVGLTGLMLLLRVPRLAITGWIVVTAFVPIWWGVSLGGYWYPGAVLGLGVIVVLLRNASWGRITAGDLGVALFFIAVLAPVLVKGALELSIAVAVVSTWALAFLVGRLALSAQTADDIYRTVGIVFAVVAGLAILEFAFRFNPFVELGGHGAVFDNWARLKERGGLLRAAAAWGHPIALGAALSMSIPLLLASSLRSRTKISLLIVTVVGVVVTLSRTGQSGVLLALVLSLYAMAPVLRRSVKAGLGLIIVVGGIIGYSFVSGVFSSSGDEFQESAAYRGDLVQLIPQIEIFGQSSIVGNDAFGKVEFNGFRSIDNAMLLLGLRHGWMAVGIALVLLAAVVVLVLLRKAEPPTIALATQIPTLFSVALITQFSMYFWFMAGLAVAAHAHGRRGSAPAAQEEPEVPHIQSKELLAV